MLLSNEIRSVEIQILLEGIFRLYGYDFRGYEEKAVDRALRRMLRSEKLRSLSALQGKMLRDPVRVRRFQQRLTEPCGRFFDEPDAFLAFRRKVIPFLKTFRSFRIWQAGADAGEETYSLAILLHEEGVYDRCKIYVTQASDVLLGQVKQGAFPLPSEGRDGRAYRRSGGKGRLHDYYSVKAGQAVFKPFLKKNIVCSEYNLVTDSSFNEFQVILCRNQLFRFRPALRQRVHQVFHESLCPLGVLILGRRDTMAGGGYEKRYRELDSKAHFYRRWIG